MFGSKRGTVPGPKLERSARRKIKKKGKKSTAKVSFQPATSREQNVRKHKRGGV